MKKYCVPCEIVLELKQIGYNEECELYWYKANNGYVIVHEKTQSFEQYIDAPLYCQLFDWFRERYDYHSYIEVYENGEFHWTIQSDEFQIEEIVKSPKTFSHEECELQLLKELIEMVKIKTQK
jgi:hypothetical protein